MDNKSNEIIRNWYYDNFGNWENNPYPDWDQDILIERAKNKIVTLSSSEKLTWDLVNKDKMNYKNKFLEIVAIPSKDEVAYAIHGIVKSELNDKWDNELQNKQNPAGLVNIEKEIRNFYFYKNMKYIIGGAMITISVCTFGYILF